MSTFANEVKLRQVVSESYTYTDVIKVMGLKVGITTINRLKKYIQQYNISTTHFTRDNRRRIWDETRLRELISTAQCYADVLASLGVRTQGANIKTLKKYIQKYDIDTSHFNSTGVRKRNGGLTKIPNEQIFIQNSSTQRVVVKRRILMDSLIEYKCETCQNTGSWQGRKLVLQLEHKNGVYNDNRLENLCFLCPNCHSQTDTYAGKNNTDH